MVAHLSTNQARRRLTSLIEANALTTMPDHQKQEMQLGIDSIFLAAAGFVQCYALPRVHADNTKYENQTELFAAIEKSSS